MRIFFNIFLPFRTFEVFADSDDIFEKFLSKVFGHFFHEPCGDEIHFCINIHPNINKSNILFDWSVPDNEIFIIKLNIVRIHIRLKLKELLKMFFVVDRSSEKEKLFTGMIKSTVADSLEKGLPLGEKRYVVERISYSAVSGYLFFGSRNFQKRGIILIKIYLNHNRNKDFEGNIRKSLDATAYSPISLSSATDFNAVFITFEIPASSFNFALIINNIFELGFNSLKKMYLLFSQGKIIFFLFVKS